MASWLPKKISWFVYMLTAAKCGRQDGDGGQPQIDGALFLDGSSTFRSSYCGSTRSWGSVYLLTVAKQLLASVARAFTRSNARPARPTTYKVPTTPLHTFGKTRKYAQEDDAAPRLKFDNAWKTNARTASQPARNVAITPQLDNQQYPDAGARKLKRVSQL